VVAAGAGLVVVRTGVRSVTTATGGRADDVVEATGFDDFAGAGSGDGPLPEEGAASGPEGDCASRGAAAASHSAVATIATLLRCVLAPIFPPNGPKTVASTVLPASQ
jgi:hypothetical protein